MPLLCSLPVRLGQETKKGHQSDQLIISHVDNVTDRSQKKEDQQTTSIQHNKTFKEHQCISSISFISLQGMSLDSMRSCLLLLRLIKVMQMIFYVTQDSKITNVHFSDCNRISTLGMLSTTEGPKMA